MSKITDQRDDNFNGSVNADGFTSSTLSLVDSVDNIERKLERRLGLRHGFSLMVGLVLGSGIFISPGLVAKDTSSAGMMLIIWVCAGLLALMGSLSYCELGCMFKMAGGNYANIFNIYGSVCAFLCAWTTCLVIDPSSISAIALTIGIYLTKPFYSTEEEAIIAAKLVAFGILLIAGFVNCVSVNLSNRIQGIFAVAQISSVLFVISVGMWQLGTHHVDNFQHMFNGTSLDIGSTLHVGIALFGALWSFDGWACMNNVIEEIQNLERNLFLTVITSFPFVICCYILVNISFLTLLSHKDMSQSKAVGVDFIQLALGKKVSYLMMVLVGLSSYGTLNGTVFATPRLTLAAAREGHMPYVFSLIHKKSAAPIPATCLVIFIASLMLLPSASNLNMLILIFSQAQWVMYGSSIFGVFLLRIIRPEIHRPYKVFIGIPMFMSLVALFLVIIPFFKNPWQSLALFGFILLGIPVYFVFIYHYMSLPKFITNFWQSFARVLETNCGMAPCSKRDL